MLINLLPDFLAVLNAADREAAYHAYFDRHRTLLTAYWETSPRAVRPHFE
jgi:hypothetical protein